VSFQNDHLRGAPAKPRAQPVGTAESDMNKSSWQKPASPHTVAATKSIGALIGGELMPPDWRASGMTGIGHDQAHHSPGPTSDMGQSLPKWAVHPMSAFPPIATAERTFRHVSKVVIGAGSVVTRDIPEGRVCRKQPMPRYLRNH
jgi:hypothetical protein